MSTNNFKNLAEPKCGRGKFIRFWKNGDPYSVCYKIYINPNNFRTWNSILAYLTDYMQPEFGAVRKVFCLRTGKPVCCFNHLDPNEKYIVAACRSGLQNMKSGYRTASEIEMLVKYKPRKLYSAEFDPDKFKFVEETSKRKLTVIFIVVSGQPCQEPSKVVLTEPDFEAWENTLRVLAKLVDLPNGILYLSTIFGDIIHSPYELQNGYVYVAVPFGEKFKHMDYMAIFGRMGLRGCYTTALNVRPSTTRRRRCKGHIIVEQSTIENPIERRIKKFCGSCPNCCSKYSFAGTREIKRMTSETQTSKTDAPKKVVSSSKAIQHSELTDKHSMTESDAETQVIDILSDIIEEATADLSTSDSPKSRKKDVTQNFAVFPSQNSYTLERVSVTKSRRKSQKKFSVQHLKESPPTVTKLEMKSRSKLAVQRLSDVTPNASKSAAPTPSDATPNLDVGSFSANQNSYSLERVSVGESERKSESKSAVPPFPDAIHNGSKSTAQGSSNDTPNLGVGPNENDHSLERVSVTESQRKGESKSAAQPLPDVTTNGSKSTAQRSSDDTPNQFSDSLERDSIIKSQRKRGSKSAVQPFPDATPNESKSTAQPPSDDTPELGYNSLVKTSVTKSERKSRNHSHNCVCCLECIDCKSCAPTTGATPILEESRAPIDKMKESQIKPLNCRCSFEFNDCDKCCAANTAERISLADSEKILANDGEQKIPNVTSEKTSWKDLRKNIEEKRSFFEKKEQLQREPNRRIPEKRYKSEKKSIPETGNNVLPETEKSKEVQTDASFVLDSFKGFENIKIKYYEQHTEYNRKKDGCVKRVVEIFNDYGNKNCICHRKSSGSISGDSIENN